MRQNKFYWEKRVACTVTLLPSGWSFAADDKDTLLAAAQAAGIRLPSSCRNGSCRTCLCRMTEGKVRYRIEWPGLTREEKAEGWILPCVAVAESDLTLEIRYAERT
jgi:ferredoxin